MSRMRARLSPMPSKSKVDLVGLGQKGELRHDPVEQPALYSQFQAAETAESYIISAPTYSEQEIHKSQN